MMNKIPLFVALCLGLTACQDEDPVEPSPAPTTPTGTTPVSFTAISFTSTNAYFSTTNGMIQPVNAATAQLVAGDIDITYIYSGDYWEPGFLAPLTRSRTWYWNEYNQPFLAAADSTELFATDITTAQFNSARTNSSLIGTYFANASLMDPAPHAIFPTGTCVGGRNCSNPANVELAEERVFGFKSHVTGKRGLIFIRTDQIQYWPDNIIGNGTKVDILREP